MSRDEGLRFLIVSYLHDLQKAKEFGEEESESLEVALQCLSGVFGVDPADEQKKSKFGTGEDLRTAYSLLESKNNASQPSEEDRKKAEQLKNEGNQEMAKKNYEAAIEKYTQAINLTPQNAIYFANRAAAYSCIQKFQEAVEDCEKSKKIDPSYSKAYSRLGLAHYQLGNYEDAVAAYAKASELEPGNEKLKGDLKMARDKVPENSKKAQSVAPTAAPSNTTPPAGGRGGMPAGGMPDLSSFMNNPNMMNMAAQMMNNPAIQRMMQDPNIARLAQNFMSSGAPPSMSDLMNNPDMLNAARSFADGNPDLAGSFGQMMSGSNDENDSENPRGSLNDQIDE